MLGQRILSTFDIETFYNDDGELIIDDLDCLTETIYKHCISFAIEAIEKGYDVNELKTRL